MGICLVCMRTRCACSSASRANATCRAYDSRGAPDASRASGGFVRACDVTEPLWATLPVADWVMSLEVAEHIPRAKEAGYLRNLHRLSCLGLIVSWATPGQGGTGHVNERWTRDVTARVTALGYEVNHGLTRRRAALV